MLAQYQYDLIDPVLGSLTIISTYVLQDDDPSKQAYGNGNHGDGHEDRRQNNEIDSHVVQCLGMFTLRVNMGPSDRQVSQYGGCGADHI